MSYPSPTGTSPTGTSPTGGLLLSVELGGGVVRAATLRFTRPVQLCEAVLGWPAAELPTAFERLYALCGRSHGIAARLALDAARGRHTPDPTLRAAVRQLAAERIGEHLRSTFATAASLGLSAEPMELTALRGVFAATRPDQKPTGLTGALAVLGLDGARPAPQSWAARMLATAEQENGPVDHETGRVDRLTPADDAAVLAALARAGSAFAAAPVLPGRRPETGALGRSGADSASPRARLAARFAEIRCAAALLLEEAEDAPAAWLASFTLPDGAGCAAVESPRGRMHHLVAVDAQDRVTRCAVLAPTEWNFHPDGPLVHALRGLRVGSGAAAAARIRWLVGLFDPCVPCALALRESADA